MAIVVEDGTGIVGANSYMTQAEFETYAEAQNWDLTPYTDEQIAAALVRGARAIDQWVKQWPGVRSNGTAQGLLWPRKAGSIQYGVYYADGLLLTVVDNEGLPIENDEIPPQLVQAQAEATWRELQNPGSMEPDLDRKVKSLKAGSVAIEYADGASQLPTYSVIDNLLAQLLPEGDVAQGAAMVSLLRV